MILLDTSKVNISSHKTKFSDSLIDDMLNRSRERSVNGYISDKANKAFQVTPDGVILPKGYEIPSNYIESPYRSGSYGIMEGKKYIEKIRFDSVTSPGYKILFSFE